MTPRIQVIVLATILGLVGAVDFVQRIHVPRSPATRESKIETPALPDQPLPLASARQRLQSWFPLQTQAPRAASSDTGNEPGDSGSGAQIPDRTDLGGWRFVLRGIFDAGPPFAVFDVMSIAGSEAEQHRLAVGEAIKGVRVVRISRRSVSLSDGENVIQLALFVDPENDVVPAR